MAHITISQVEPVGSSPKSKNIVKLLPSLPNPLINLIEPDPASLTVKFEPGNSYGGISRAPDQNAPLGNLLWHQFRFDSLARDLLASLIAERVNLSKRHRIELAEQISLIQSYLFLWKPMIYSPEAQANAEKFENIKSGLEKMLWTEELSFWKDTSKLFQDLLVAEKQYQSTKFRFQLLKVPEQNESNSTKDAMGAGYMPSPPTPMERTV